MKNTLRIASLALLFASGVVSATVARADVKIKTKSTSGGQASEQTTYIKGKRQRSENGEASVSITQCDLRRSLQLGVPTKTYVVTPFNETAGATAAKGAQTPAAGAATTNVRRGGIVTSTYTTTDTGERRKMFGYVARHIKSSIMTESSPDACQVNRTRMEQDGWYIDAQFALDCENAAAAAFAQLVQAGGCRDEYRTKQVGTAKLGYPVLLKTTVFDENGQESFTFSQEVVEITNAVLDSALFEAPADYRQVSDQRELYGAAGATTTAQADGDEGDVAAKAAGGGEANAKPVVGAKRAGVVRVGVAQTKTLAAGDHVDPAALAEAVRNTLSSNLSNPSIEVVSLEARQSQGVETEARQKECDFVLYTTVAHKKGGGGGGGGFGGFLKKSAAIAAGGGVASPSNDSGGGGNQSGAARSLKAKDELTLEYKLQRGTEPVVANTLKAKAKSDGEDIISQLAVQVAAAVRGAATASK